jgi:hypothetical protein
MELLLLRVKRGREHYFEEIMEAVFTRGIRGVGYAQDTRYKELIEGKKLLRIRLLLGLMITIIIITPASKPL